MSCPICKEMSSAKYRPFCSKRCADIDLGRWIKGDYAIPADDPENLEQAASEIQSKPPIRH